MWEKPEWEVSALEDFNRTFESITNEASSSVEVWAGRAKVKLDIKRYVDVRYEGQGHELSILLPDGKLGQAQMAALAADFKETYERTYGYNLKGVPLRIVTVRLVATVATKRPRSTTAVKSAVQTTSTEGPQEIRKAYWGEKYGFIDTPVSQFEQIGLNPIKGPFLVDCYDTTIVVPPDCTATRGNWGNVTINIGSEGD